MRQGHPCPRRFKKSSWFDARSGAIKQVMKLSNLILINILFLALSMYTCKSLCRYNDIGYVANTFVDYVSLVRGMGLADKHELLQTLDFTIPKFVRNEMDRRQKISTRWYGVTLSVLSQLIDPVRNLIIFEAKFEAILSLHNLTNYILVHKDEYAAKMTKTFAKKSTMQLPEWEMEFKKDFFDVSPKLMKRARYAVSIADPGLGDQWWRQVQ